MSAGKYGTSFTESELVLAAQVGDREHIKELIDGMLPGERWELRENLQSLAMMLIDA